MVSKPIAPPWNDGGKNLVKDLVSHGEKFRYRVFTPQGSPLQHPQVISEPIYQDAGRFTPSLGANARVLARLCRRDDAVLRHYFFAPNLLTSQAARLVGWLRRGPTVQTVASLPRDQAFPPHLFFADRVIALSRFSLGKLQASGLAPERVVHIPPCIKIPSALDHAARTRGRERHGLSGHVVIYPGDYQFSRGAEITARALPWVAAQQPDVTFVFACRIKQPASRDIEARIHAELAAAGQLGRARFLNDVPSMPDLLAAADIVVLPAESTYAKMDLPLVLLEAMSLGLPLVVASGGPLAELADGDAALTVPPEDSRALAEILLKLIDDPMQCRDLGERARLACKSRYHAPDIAQRHEELYQDLLARYRGAL